MLDHRLAEKAAKDRHSDRS